MADNVYNYIQKFWETERQILITYHSDHMSTVTTFSDFECRRYGTRIEVFDDRCCNCFDCEDFDRVTIIEEDGTCVLETDDCYLEISRV